jgi:hypothetical protein
MKAVTFLILFILFPFIAFAQVVAPVDLSSAASFLPAILAFFKSGNYLAAGAMISLILTWAIKTYVLPKINLGTGVLPLVAAVIGVLGGVGLAVANGGTLAAASMAVLSGPLATALWEGILQYFVPSAVPAPIPPPVV